MRQDNRGITLLEVLIAVAGSVIVISAASLFINNALKSYKLAANTADFRVEAQVLMEQLSTWIMEGNYYDIDNNNGVFVIYNYPREAPEGVIEDLTEERWMRVFLCSEDERLYVQEKTGSDVPAFSDRNVTGETVEKTTKNLLSNYVRGLNVIIKEDDEGTPYKVKITLLMKSGNQEYELTDEINIRNEIYEPGT